jgi:CDP-paratose 2-epimerase
MSVILVTGSAGLIGSEAAQFFCQKEATVVGIDNDMRSFFFGQEASTNSRRDSLVGSFDNYIHKNTDIRSQRDENIFREYNSDITLIIHAAAQPSHDWAARDPHTDFTVNANGTLNLLECTRQFSPERRFYFYFDQQSLRRPPERTSARRAGNALGNRFVASVFQRN